MISSITIKQIASYSISIIIPMLMCSNIYSYDLQPHIKVDGISVYLISQLLMKMARELQQLAQVLVLLLTSKPLLNKKKKLPQNHTRKHKT